ncbi:hypothetical protein EOA13_36215 [Mesorhizobium sp. M7A.F.Ca.US.011.01.1.1]|uniref:hypothetical protein n=1 Tax=Mesorhizobium sp. M7A.F.Ca.US.011.01.1.1 TaxID=2496741 RepID=UPI000FCC0B45|nr:hypothetical protein [Mesorhizobium sp. M7A.F.Ca.US.011.01.1.1]RUX22294.1 hypothetical protein EOA13_36215 [Mesorhizobium sp. M7A.F.Ca.US.011.01.1.1]
MPGVSDPARYINKEVEHFHPVHHALRRKHMRKLITPDVIEEHRRNPLGYGPDFHSWPLHHLLGYFRTQPESAYLMPYHHADKQSFGIAVSTRGQEPFVLEGHSYPTVDAARHSIFEMRVAELTAEEGSDDA